MTTEIVPSVSLDQARALVAYLEADQISEANALFDDIVAARQEGQTVVDDSLFDEIGKLTRELHTALNDFQLDPRLADLAKEDIPDATARLSYVIDMTEQAANRTMDAVEASLPVTDKLIDSISGLQGNWHQVLSDRVPLAQFTATCHQTDEFLGTSLSEAEQLRAKLTEVLMAQDFQDLTGQVIRRVIDLVKEVEDNLISLLKVFGEPVKVSTIDPKEKAIKAEGPIMEAHHERDDVVSGQDDVDDLLSSLGF